jgi:hypothetical protein
MLNQHSAPRFAIAVIAVLPIVTCLSLGCSEAPPTRPSERITVASVSPNTGPAATTTELTIRGSGFEPGASVSVGGAATSIRVMSTSLIIATTPIFPAGKVDVVVTNPNRQSGRLAGAFTYLGLVLTDVSPNRGIRGDFLTIRGSGFSTETVLTVGGVASAILLRTSTSLSALAPSLPPGMADITVTNPNGERQTLTQAFMVETVVISASPTTVVAGHPLTVTWGAPDGRPAGDWVGLFRAGEANENDLWYVYVKNAMSGTITIPAPAGPGDYQFRYLVDDGYTDAARSGVVIVTAPSRPVQRLAGVSRSPR